MIYNRSEVMIVPAAGNILTFFICYELIVLNTWNIVMAVFDAAQNVVSQLTGLIISDADIDVSR